jgi:hypothetical protein
MYMKKKLVNDEIDLIEVFQIIWGKKYNIILSIVISLFLAFLIQISLVKSNIKNEINTITEISPIEIIDESKYKVYNSALVLITPFSSTDNTREQEIIKPLEINEPHHAMSNLGITYITKELLLKMFFEEINSRKHIIYVIKKYNFIKEENYPNIKEYEAAIDEIFSNFRVLNQVNLNSQDIFFKIKIKYKTDDIKSWINFLKFLELETNIIIQKKLIRMFDNYLNYTKILKKFQIEDLKSLSSTTNDDSQILNINKRLSKLNKYYERINFIFKSSPINNKEEFYAAKINYDTMDYKKTKVSLKILYVSAILLGAILGIIFILIANAIQKRSKKIIS